MNKLIYDLKPQTPNGELMAQCLEKIAKSGGVNTISDPSEWQREIRIDRNIYSHS